MGDFASITVEWDPWEPVPDAWRCRGVAEVAGNTALLVITVLYSPKPDTVPHVAVRWDLGSEPTDDAVLREANRLALAHANAHRKALAAGGAS